MSDDKNKKPKSSIVQTEGDLYDVWDELRRLTDVEIGSFNLWSKKVNDKLLERKVELEKVVAPWQALIMKIERKRYNLEAMRRGKKIPFEDVKTNSKEILSDAKRAIDEAKARAAVKSEDPEEFLDVLSEQVEELKPEEQKPEEQKLEEPLTPLVEEPAGDEEIAA